MCAATSMGLLPRVDRFAGYRRIARKLSSDTSWFVQNSPAGNRLWSVRAIPNTAAVGRHMIDVKLPAGFQGLCHFDHETDAPSRDHPKRLRDASSDAMLG